MNPNPTQIIHEMFELADRLEIEQPALSNRLRTWANALSAFGWAYKDTETK